MAAWVQAIGSIGAIFVAIGVAWYQNRSQRRHADAQLIAQRALLLEPVVGLMAHAHWLVDQICQAAAGIAPLDELVGDATISDDFELTIKTLQQVPAHTLPSQHLAIFFMDMNRLIKMAHLDLMNVRKQYPDVADSAEWIRLAAKAEDYGAASSRALAAFKSALRQVQAGEPVEIFF